MGICNITRNANDSRLVAYMSRDIKTIPENYFCTFSFTLEQSENCLIDIFRRAYNHRQPKETIDVKIVQYKDDDSDEISSVNYLSNSIIIRNSRRNRMTYNTQA